jgi:trans-aconitate 2-methyltransferase
MTASMVAEGAFTPEAARVRQVLERVFELMPPDAAWRVLDLGCGTGDAAFDLAAARPAAHVTAVDLSSASIEAAEERRGHDPSGERVHPRQGDYLALDLGAPFDLIVANQSLHLIADPAGRLVPKLAADLTENGLLVVDMPYRGPYNAMTIAIRRVLGRLRGPRLDAAALRAARALHRGSVSTEQLRERLVYLYVVPERLAGKAFDAQLERAGLDLVDRRPMRQASPAQPRHHLSVYRKRP